ncbi:MAG: fumarylacetoacetate hydrolase family protein [Candidatus Contendobacter sp.]|jgi:2-keto-4-pentenoate hydratase/2-oxohepta-3-ene-1,7-dioic acid hydratase in catechol pathway|nr:fumarylacetoacetate hydrolase family protein [Candidatus Contendobacter sp.]
MLALFRIAALLPLSDNTPHRVQKAFKGNPVVYQHRYLDGSPLALPIGKVVCIGRNYLDHVRELNNAVPETPILFMKPATALVSLDEPIRLPAGRGACHHEVELAVLVGRELRNVDVETARMAVAGYGIALDLTLRDLQNELKKKGYPWETAKAFDGACPLSPFLKPDALPDPQATDVALQVNGEWRQQGNTRQMIIGIFALMACISAHFTLQPGDVVLTGTPAGVGPLPSGAALRLRLADHDFNARLA